MCGKSRPRSRRALPSAISLFRARARCITRFVIASEIGCMLLIGSTRTLIALLVAAFPRDPLYASFSCLLYAAATLITPTASRGLGGARSRRSRDDDRLRRARAVNRCAASRQRPAPTDRCSLGGLPPKAPLLTTSLPSYWTCSNAVRRYFYPLSLPRNPSSFAASTHRLSS